MDKHLYKGSSFPRYVTACLLSCYILLVPVALEYDHHEHHLHQPGETGDVCHPPEDHADTKCPVCSYKQATHSMPGATSALPPPLIQAFATLAPPDAATPFRFTFLPEARAPPA